MCLTYTHKNPPGTQWGKFPSLPGDRAGCAMWLDSASGSLIVGAGASRPSQIDPKFTLDHRDVYQIFLNNTSVGWKTQSNIFPYFTNHVGRATVTVPTERHFAMGGQFSESELTDNRAQVYELNMFDFSWSERKFMPFARGHISESTLTWKNCGIIVVAGAVNLTFNPNYRTDDISFYDLSTDSWTSIGKFTDAVASPICTIHGGYLYCQSGYVWKHLARRIRIE
jgi:hypothetical protein